MERFEYKISGRCKDYCKYENCEYVWISAGSFHQGTGFDEETAAFIVRACNSHDDLVKALEACITSEGASCFGDMEQHPEWMQRRLYAISDLARAALAKAKGG